MPQNSARAEVASVNDRRVEVADEPVADADLRPDVAGDRDGQQDQRQGQAGPDGARSGRVLVAAGRQADHANRTASGTAAQRACRG